MKKFSFPTENRQFRFEPKNPYDLVAEPRPRRGEALTFPDWCIFTSSLEPTLSKTPEKRKHRAFGKSAALLFITPPAAPPPPDGGASKQKNSFSYRKRGWGGAKTKKRERIFLFWSPASGGMRSRFLPIKNIFSVFEN